MGAREDLLFYRFGRPSSAVEQIASTAFDEVDSVIAEVELLLNTRSTLPASANPLRRTVLDYGLADFSHYSPCSRQDAELLGDLIRDTVIAHEPRLVIGAVKVDTPRPCRDALSVLISGHVKRRDSSMVPVSFPVMVGQTA